MEYKDLIYLLLPLASGFGVGMICKTTAKAGSTVKFRPPGWVFGVAWTILYLLLGISWMNSKQYSIIYMLLILTLCSWQIVYSCAKNKNLALAIIVAALGMCLLTYTAVGKTSKYLLVPLFIWLMFALLLSVFELQN